MSETDAEIVAIGPGNHGMPIEELASAIEDRLPDRAVATATTPAEKREHLHSARIAVGIDLDPRYLEAAERLALFASTYAGTGHIDLEAFEDRGIAVTSASGVHGPNIGEYVLGGILAHVRRFEAGMHRQRRHEWRHFQAMELKGSTVTVVGLGPIGTAVVDRLSGFGVSSIGVRYTPEKGGPTDEVIGFEEGAFHEALSRSDVLVLACPLTETTRGLVGTPELETLPPDALVVNIARGPIVDTDALVDALQRNSLGGAVLDVTEPEPLPADHPLWDLGNVRITPHNAGHTPAYYERVADILVDNVARLDRGERDLTNRVV